MSGPKARYESTPAPPKTTSKTAITPVKTAGNLRGSRIESVIGMTYIIMTVNKRNMTTEYICTDQTNTFEWEHCCPKSAWRPGQLT